MILNFKMNNKAQFESILLAIVTIFILGIILFFFNHVNDQLYTSLGDYFEENNYNESLVAVQKIQAIDNSIWDYAFLAIFFGMIIQIIMFSFATRINIAFFWLMIIIDIPLIIVGVILSNIWQEIAVNPEFATTIARFPITDSLLGTYYPVAIVGLIFFSLLRKTSSS